MKYSIIFILIATFISCTKSDNSPNPSHSITGIWHDIRDYGISPGNDTTYDNYHERSDAQYAMNLKSDGTMYAVGIDTLLGYYRVISDSFFFSDQPIPRDAVTYFDSNNYHYVQGWHIDKLTSQEMDLSVYGVDFINSYTYSVYRR